MYQKEEFGRTVKCIHEKKHLESLGTKFCTMCIHEKKRLESLGTKFCTMENNSNLHPNFESNTANTKERQFHSL